MPDDDLFLALANPVRRRLLELLTDGPRTAGDLAASFDLSRPAVAEHLQILRRAGLVHDQPTGRQRHYHLTAEPLAQVGDWLHPFERFWRHRLRTLADMLQEETMTDTATIAVDQFIAAPPSKVWRSLTEPELFARWWVPGDIAAVVGHRFHLQMPGWGAVACEVTEVEPERRFVYTFNENWTLTWRLVPEGNGTRLFLDHSGFDLDDPRARDAFARMGPGWRDKILPGLAQLAADLPD
ncbi:metalloregulator ArsR/SmtB family transcription factor [Micromonospora ureilytica]|uniref:metalloregulator ArsR/SmtB family transcription factor n=1 Tax=Micromonospora ureilytica TaxID=709868 RepID=UPI0033EE2B23